MEIQTMHSSLTRFKPSLGSQTVLNSSLCVRRDSPYNLVVRSEKDRKGKDVKGKKKGQGQGAGKSRSEPASKKSSDSKKPRGNVWSKDIAETEYRSLKQQEISQAPKSKQRASPAVQVKERREEPRRIVARDASFAEQDLDFNEYIGMVVSGPIPVVVQQVLQSPETMPNPLWPTFVSSNRGVWKGVGAAFSPITAEMEPISLGLKNEYLYDALIRCTVEQIPGPESDKPSESSLYRKVMWKVGNFVGEQGFDELQLQTDLFEEEEEEEEVDEDAVDGAVSVGINPIELASSGITEGMVLPEAPDNLFGTVEETKEFLQGLEGSGTGPYNPEEAIREGGVLREGDPEWESMYKAGAVDEGLVEELKNVSAGIKLEDDNWQDSDVPTHVQGYEPSFSGSDDEWKDVMEEDIMSIEPGLVFFSDGSYSRGPISLLPDELAASEREYYKSPTFKIEQCIVTGKHRRLRIVHTIAIEDSGEAIQVLRVAAYEEQWMGPSHMQSISESGDVNIQRFSQQSRIWPNELTGSWKVFEMSATSIYSPAASPTTRPTYAYFCQEVLQTQGLPEPMEEFVEDEDEVQQGNSGPVTDDPTMLWLPGGITASVEAKEDGILSVGVGWCYEEGTMFTMERDYGPDGRLVEVRSQTKVKGGWAGGRM